MIFNLLPISTPKVAVQLLSQDKYSTNQPLTIFTNKQIRIVWNTKYNLHSEPLLKKVQCTHYLNIQFICPTTKSILLQDSLAFCTWPTISKILAVTVDQADIAITLLESRTRQSDSLPPVKPKSTKSTWSKILFIKICMANCRNG